MRERVVVGDEGSRDGGGNDGDRGIVSFDGVNCWKEGGNKGKMFMALFLLPSVNMTGTHCVPQLLAYIQFYYHLILSS